MKVGKHIIKFIPKKEAILEKEPEINEIENSNNFMLNIKEQAQDGNRRPWITIALINLPTSIFDISITCEKRKWDRDDAKIIIDNKIHKHETLKWGKNWFWQGRELKGDTLISRFYFNLKESNHYIELWADRMPTLNDIWMHLRIKKEGDKIIPKTSDDIIQQINELYVEVGNEIEFKEIPVPVKNFIKYDKEIEIASKEFDIDPIILKTTIAQESSFGKRIDHDERYIGESGLMGLEKKMSIAQLKNLGYDFDYSDIGDVIRASAAYYKWLKSIKVDNFKDNANPLKLYVQYRSDIKAKHVTKIGIKQFLFYYFYYKE